MRGQVEAALDLVERTRKVRPVGVCLICLTNRNEGCSVTCNSCQDKEDRKLERNKP